MRIISLQAYYYCDRNDKGVGDGSRLVEEKTTQHSDKIEKNYNHTTLAIILCVCTSCVCVAFAVRPCERCAAGAMDPTVVVMEHAPPMAECHWVSLGNSPTTTPV